jgi:hypothetical protein
MYINVGSSRRPYIRRVLASFLDLGLLREGVLLAGGAIRDALNGNTEIADYDLFFSNSLEAQRTALFLEDDLGFECVFKCPLGELTTFKKDGMKIQLITKFFYGSMEEVIDNFDITACRHVTDGKRIFTQYSSVRDTFDKKINLHRIDFPNATMKRIQKYIQKGFTLTNKAVDVYIDRIYTAGLLADDLDRRFYVD